VKPINTRELPRQLDAIAAKVDGADAANLQNKA
jgi:hypothetical protein